MWPFIRRHRRALVRFPRTVLRKKIRGRHEVDTSQAHPRAPSTEEVTKSPQEADKAPSSIEAANTDADLAPKRARSESDALYSERSNSVKRVSTEIRETKDLTNGSHNQAEVEHGKVQACLTTLDPYIVSVPQDGVPTVALFINKEGYDEVRKAFSYGRRVRRLKKKMKTIEGDIKQADPLIGFCRAEIENEETTEERKAILHKEIEEIEETRAKALAKKEVLEPKIDYDGGFLNFIQQSFLSRIQNAMMDVGVLDADSTENEEDDSDSDKQERQEKTERERSTREEQAQDEISIGEIRRGEAREGIINARIALGDAQDAFEARNQNYRERFEWWREAMMNGATSETRSEFDVNDLLHCQKVTRDLIIAEDRYRGAKQYALEVDSQGGWNSIDRESIFFNHPHDGYYSWEPEEGDEKSHHGASDTFIHRWVEDVVAMNEAAPKQAGDGQESELQQPDPHVQEDIDSPSFRQARSLSFAVSIADIDQGWRRDKIDDWNAFCGRDR